MRIQEILQIENTFHLEMIGEEGDTQLNLKWINLDEKRNREDYCEGCKTKELRKSVIGLVEKLVGVKVFDKPVVVEKKVEPVVKVGKRKKGVLYLSKMNGKMGWSQLGDKDKDGKYLGEIVTGVPNGQGTYTFPDGKTYVGKWKDGKYNGEGIFTRPSGTKYVGEFKDGEKNGQGILTSPYGFKFDGEWKNNKPWNGILYDNDGKINSKYLNGVKKVEPVVVVEKNEKGVLYERKVNGEWGWYKSGNEKKDVKYVGEIENGEPNGQGTYSFPDGSSYEGEWKDDKYYVGEYHGQGTYTYPDGRKYVGEFKDGLYLGQGTLTSSDGGKYVGEFKDGEPNGLGTFTSPGGDKYVGDFKDGKYHGQGTYTSSLGFKYVGEYKDGKKHGQGTYTWGKGKWEGDKYVGEYMDGGEWNGTIYDKNGNITEKYVNGKSVKQ